MCSCQTSELLAEYMYYIVTVETLDVSYSKQLTD